MKNLTDVRQSVTLWGKEIVIDQLEWDDYNSHHINKHAVSMIEVQESCVNQITVLSGYSGRQMLFGKTNSGRYVTVILAKQVNNIYYVVTARDTSKKERRYVYDQEKNK